MCPRTTKRLSFTYLNTCKYLFHCEIGRKDGVGRCSSCGFCCLFYEQVALYIKTFLDVFVFCLSACCWNVLDF